ncbi:MAG: beta strand repeat-containing protein, partial [Chthoniobacterales bacterium]
MATQAILSVGTNTTRIQNILIQNNSTNSVVNVASGSAFTATGSLTQDGTPANTTKFGKDGAGTLILAGASGNSYNGQIQIGQGTVIAGTSTALGTNTSTTARGIDLGLNITDVSQANSVALRASNGVTVGQSIYVAPNTGNALRTIGLAGTGSATFNNEIFLDGTLTVDAGANASDSVTISGVMANTGGLNKEGAGTLIVSGNNSYTGATAINAGTLRLGADNRISSQSAISIASGATLDMNGFADTLGALSGSGNVTLGAGALTTSVGADSIYSGVISGSGKFVKAGTAVLTLNGVSTYTGNTEIDAGTLSIGSTGGLSGSSMLYLGSGLNGSDATLSVAGTTTLANAIQVNTNNGTSGARTLIKSDATSQTLSGNFTNNIQTSVNVANSAGNLALSGAMAGSGNIVKVGEGTLALSGGSGSFSGGLFIDQGTLNLAGGSTGASAIEIGGGSTVNAINASNATLRVSTNGTFSQGLTINANTNASGQSGSRTIAFANSGGTATLSGALSHEKAFTVNVANAGATGILSGLISSNTTGGTTITVSGNGILGVSNTGNTTDARWSVSSGSTLAIGNTRNLGENPGGYYSDKVTLNGGTLLATNNFSLNANVGIQLAASTTSAISVGSGLVMTNPAVMGGSGNLTKSGSGTLVLSGNNTYTGSTTVSQGELRMMGVLSSSSLLNV